MVNTLWSNPSKWGLLYQLCIFKWDLWTIFFTNWLELGHLELKTRWILYLECRVTVQISHTNVSGFKMQ